MWWKGHTWKLWAPAAVLLVAALAVILWPETDAPGQSVASPTVRPPVTATVTPTEPPNSPVPSASPPAQASPTPPASAPPSVPAAAATSATAAQPDEDEALCCTVSISCAALLDHLDELDEAQRDLVPPDGWLLSPTELEFEAGESVFDVLRRVCRDEGIHLEFSSTPLYPSAYVEGIGNLYQFDCGAMSGWTYTLNGQSFNFSSSDCVLERGDVVAWQYTL